jgi:hypothetical protein
MNTFLLVERSGIQWQLAAEIREKIVNWSKEPIRRWMI